MSHFGDLQTQFAMTGKVGSYWAT